MKNRIKQFYESKYKMLLIIPFAILLLALVQIGVQYQQTGDFVNKGVTLKGGSTFTLTDGSVISVAELSGFLATAFPDEEMSVRTLGSAGSSISLAIDSSFSEKADITKLELLLVKKLDLQKNDYTIEVMGSSLGERFFTQTLTALLIAFVLMGIVVFFYFKSPAPSFAVILAAFSDIVVTVSIFNLTGIPLSTAGIAAFLMLIGYSVDTDILLSSRVLKRKEGSVMSRVYGAMKTGLTMSATTLTAVIVALIFVKSDVVKQIMIILLIGLLVDLLMTWIQNVGILRLYLEKKHGKN